MSNTTLVILAAGIGSRYGGIKQLDGITPKGDTLIDFSIFDAIDAGISKIVFIVREQIRQEFKALFDEKLKRENLEVEYVNQEVDSIPNEFLPIDRKKPWGTGHALLMAKDLVNENFCVINADDFYGRSAFKKIYRNLQRIDSSKNEFLMVGYRVDNALSANGSVSRGQCVIDEKNKLERIIERTEIYRRGDKIVYSDTRNLETEISPNEIVSMNFWGFTPRIFEELKKKFFQFLKVNYSDENAEFFLPTVVNDLIKENKATVEVLRSDANWMGITYKTDKLFIIEEIKRLQENRTYPNKIW